MLLAAALATPAARDGNANNGKLSPLDTYIAAAKARGAAAVAPASGSLWRAGGALTDLTADLKASRIDDVVTIVVAERASAVAQGTTKSTRQSAAAYSVTAAGGVMRAASPLTNLLGVTGANSLQGEGATSRNTELTTTLSARVADVLPNGDLVIEGSKLVQVNSESQIVTVRGIVRPFDIGPGNAVGSDRLAQMEVRINGKGVVDDSIRRPNFLYRLLLGLLPF